jgi:uncharacterized membrane protein YccC
LPDPNSYQAIGWLCVMVAMIAVGINAVFKLIDRFRGKEPHPPNEQLEIKRLELERRINSAEALVARIGEDRAKDLREIETERRRSATALYQKMEETKDELTQSSGQGQTELHRKIETTEQRLLGRIETSDKISAKGFQDIERSIGRLEGKIASS